MKSVKMKMELMIVSVVLLLLPIAHASPPFEWTFVTPCIHALTCTVPANNFCVCETDWDDPNAWAENQCQPLSCPDHAYPNVTTDNVTIQKSNTGTCGGGMTQGSSMPGQICGSDSDCSFGQVCMNLEKRLDLKIVSVAIGILQLSAVHTAAITDKLEVLLLPKTGSQTLTVNRLFLSGSGGVLTLRASSGAALRTTTAD